MRMRGMAAGLALAMTFGQAQAQNGPVRIGVLTDMSSSLSDTQGMGSVEGARMAVEDFGGTVLGRKIEVVHADHQNKADIGATTARRWFDTEDVRLVVDLGS